MINVFTMVVFYNRANVKIKKKLIYPNPIDIVKIYIAPVTVSGNTLFASFVHDIMLRSIMYSVHYPHKRRKHR